MTQFRDAFYASVPPWLATGNAERYLYTLELMRDLLLEKCNQAQKIRLPGQGDPSQIPFLAHDRQLVQGPLETDENFVLRLREAFPTWNEAGSAIAVLGQLQAYAQGQQPATPGLNQFTIVSNQRTLVGGSKVTTWWTLNLDDPLGAEPLLSTVSQNFDWDGNDEATWRCWLVVFQYSYPTGQSGSAGATGGAGGGSFTEPGHNVNGVWVPNTSSTPINAPFLTLSGLTGLTADNVGDVITISGSGEGNNGLFQISQVFGPTLCEIVSPNGVTGDAGPLTWSIARYPWIPPGPAWGTEPLVWGQGEGAIPPIDTGSNVRGTWQPTILATTGKRPSYSWGLRVSSLEIEALRELVRTWKSGGTYYPNIIISYDDDNGLAFDRTLTEGAGNPDGSFGSVGHNVNGVWVPTRLISSPWDCYCQGTGSAVACAVDNIT